MNANMNRQDSLGDVAWWAMPPAEVVELLETDTEIGLSAENVIHRQKVHGKNIFEKPGQISTFSLLAKQIASPLVIILLGAGFFTLILGHYPDAMVIFLAFLINIGIGIYQERRAGKAFEKLASSQERFAIVLRRGENGGEKFRIPVSEVVLGDIVFLEQGAYIPADVRIIKENNFSVNESILTGEWSPVSKDSVNDEDTRRSVAKKTFIEQPNMAWMGTFAMDGSAVAVVVETGMRTQIGKIASLIADEKRGSKTPLEKSIAKLAQFLGIAVAVSTIFIFFLGVAREIPISEMLLVSVALAVAIMPEGLPAAVTVILALGMEQILRKGGLIKNLAATETLGGATVILTDKTGTLTVADMAVESLITADTVSKINADNNISIIHTERMRRKWEEAHQSERNLLDMAVLASDTYIDHGEIGRENTGEWTVRGKPLDRAIAKAGMESGSDQEKLFHAFPRVDFFPFRSEYRFSASLHKLDSKKFRLLCLGSPEELYSRTPFMWKNGIPAVFSRAVKREFESVQRKKSEEGMRIVGVAWKDVEFNAFPKNISDIDMTKIFDGMVFSGLLILHDPIRRDAAESVQMVQSAGARVIMVTGDYIGTAEKVAIETGITTRTGKSVTGSQVEEMSDGELLTALEESKIFARVLPHQKLRIARVLRENGEIVAMTGDGVNDAPALRHADIGIALGSGTEVAKEASDMVLLGDGFSALAATIEEGRRILDNLKKAVVYLLSTAWSEAIVVGTAIAVGMPLPLLPGQILWANIIGEGFMNFAFAFEPAEKNIMLRDPRDSSMKSILTKKIISLIISIAASMGIILVLTYFMLIHYYHVSPETTRSLVFLALSASSIFFAFSLKNLNTPIWRTDIFNNSYLILSFAISLGVLAIAFSFPPLRNILSLTVITANQAISMIGVGFVNLLCVEITKMALFRDKKL